MYSQAMSIIVGLATVMAAGLAQGQEREIKISMSSASLATASARVAQELGLYKKHGLKPTFAVMESSNVATMGLISGSVDFTVGGPQEMIVAQARGRDVISVANLYRGPSFSVVLSKAAQAAIKVAPTAPVADRLKAMNGLVIASPGPTSNQTFALKSTLEKAGVKVSFAYMAFPAMPAALATGAIQGYIASAPFWAAPVMNGTGVFWLSGPGGDFPPENVPVSAVTLQTTRAFATANPEIIAKIAGVFDDMSRAVGERPQDVKAATAKLFPDLSAEALDLLFQSESRAWQTKPLTVADMAGLVAFVKTTTADLPEIDRLDPASLLFALPPK